MSKVLIHFDYETWEYEIMTKSYDEYVAAGGRRDHLDAYARIKELAKQHESSYITLMDMKCQGVHVDDYNINKQFIKAQAYWHLLGLWFNKPVRVVDYRTFDLEKFNKL